MPRRGRGASTPRAADADAAARAGVLDDRSRRLPRAAGRAAARRLDRASGISTARSRPRHAGSSATRHHGPAGARTLIPRPAISWAAMRAVRALTVAASSTPAFVNAAASASAARRSPPVSSVSKRRTASAATRRTVDRCSSRVSAASIRSMSPSAPHACAARGSSPRSSYTSAARRWSPACPSNPPRTPERSAFELGEGGPAAAGCQRLRGRDADRRQLVRLVLVGWLVSGRLAVFSRRRRARQRIREHLRGGVEIGQRYVGDVLLAGADRAEQRRQGFPVLLAAQAADQADEVAAAENRQLGIERAPSGTHPEMLPYDAPVFRRA